ncbi:MAG: adenine deaminase, partial [Prolixibacteraceae bacterium]|nr:adenine deaminase [Prolixibacteraceae bacterium]
KFNHERIVVYDLKKEVKNSTTVISLTDGELLTAPYEYQPDKPLKNLESDIKNDILKIVYINRYYNGAPQVSFIKGFHFKKGAIASSVSHDSHNILSVGCSDEAILEAVNRLIEEKGGLTVSFEGKTHALPLPVGGIMSDKTGEEVAARYSELCDYVRQMGCNLRAPFMTLSFMSLVVIPEIKIGEKGLFSYSKFNWLK